MVDLRDFKFWTAHWARCAVLVGSLSLLASGMESTTAAAEWISLPGLRKSKEEAAPIPTSRSNYSVDRILNDARTAEQQGNLDRAIVLAERAQRIASIPPRGGKTATGPQYAAASAYLDELQQKKVQEITKRSGNLSRQKRSVAKPNTTPEQKIAASESEAQKAPKSAAGSVKSDDTEEELFGRIPTNPAVEMKSGPLTNPSAAVMPESTAALPIATSSVLESATTQTPAETATIAIPPARNAPAANIPVVTSPITKNEPSVASVVEIPQPAERGPTRQAIQEAIAASDEPAVSPPIAKTEPAQPSFIELPKPSEPDPVRRAIPETITASKSPPASSRVTKTAPAETSVAELPKPVENAPTRQTIQDAITGSEEPVLEAVARDQKSPNDDVVFESAKVQKIPTRRAQKIPSTELPVASVVELPKPAEIDPTRQSIEGVTTPSKEPATQGVVHDQKPLNADVVFEPPKVQKIPTRRVQKLPAFVADSTEQPLFIPPSPSPVLAPNDRTAEKLATEIAIDSPSEISGTATVSAADERPGRIVVSEDLLEPVAAEQPQKVAKQFWEDEDLPTKVTPMPSSTRKPKSEPKTAETSKRIKLRPRYSDENRNTAGHAELAKTSPRVEDGPTMNPMDRRLLIDQSVESKTQTTEIQPDTVPSTSDKSKTSPTTSEMALSELERHEEELIANAFSDAEEKQSDQTVTDHNEFPASKVLELKRRLDSIASLQPGTIAPLMSTEDLRDFFDDAPEETPIAQRPLIKLRMRKSGSEDSSTFDLTPIDSVESTTSTEPIVTNSVRTQIVGKSSLIKWRGMSNDLAGGTLINGSASKSTAAVDDLRQSLGKTAAAEERQRPVETPLFSLPSVNFGQTKTNDSERRTEAPARSARVLAIRPQWRGSLWDNATAPSIEGYSGAVDGSRSSPEIEDRDSNHTTSVTDLIPIPPNVEQTSFDAADERISSNSLAKQNEQSISVPEQDVISHVSLPSATTSREPGDSAPEWNPSTESLASTGTSELSTEMPRSIAMSSFTERLAFVLGISTEAVSKILNVSVLGTILIGLWMTRAVLRTTRS